MAGADGRSIGQLLKDLRTEVTTLLREEVDLAKAEMGEAAGRVGGYVGQIAIGGGVLFAGALALLAALVVGVAALLYHWLTPATANWVAPLIVGLALAAFGYSRVRSAVAGLKQTDLTPRKTTQTLQENKEWLQAKI